MAASEDKPKKKRATRSKARLVSKVIAKIEEKIETDEVKPTVGDLVRLLTLKKELEQEQQPKEIKVSWVDKDEKEHASEE